MIRRETFRMLVYFLPQSQRDAIEQLLSAWSPALREKMRFASYEDASGMRYGDVSAVIFGDCDLLNAEQRAGFGALCDGLAARDVKVLNHPQHALGRSALLRRLQEADINAFRVHTVAEAGAARFPVFLRFTHGHHGPQSPLLHNHDELKNAVAAGQRKGVPLEGMMAVEFCETAGPDRLYRSYSAFYVDGEVLPRQALAGGSWNLRKAELVSPEWLAQERAYLEHNPHADVLRRIFRMAQIDYGRVDYGLLEGRPQVWEINTNPLVHELQASANPAQLATQRWFAPRFVRLLQRLITPPR